MARCVCGHRSHYRRDCAHDCGCTIIYEPDDGHTTPDSVLMPKIVHYTGRYVRGGYSLR